MKVLLRHEEPWLRHLVFSSTVSQTGHQGWYWMRVLGASAMGTTRAEAAPIMARKKVAAFIWGPYISNVYYIL